MVDLTKVKVRGELYVPDKYKNQATEYGNCVSGVTSSLDGAIAELDNINSMLGLNSESAKDVLTKNVLVGNQEIKEEIRALAEDLDNCSSVVSSVAKDLDEELEQEAIAVAEEMERQEALRKARIKKLAEENLAKAENKKVEAKDPDLSKMNLNPHYDKDVSLLY